MTAAIRVTGLSKSYRVHHNRTSGAYRTLRESLVDMVKAPARRLRGEVASDRSEEFWALQDVDFEVQPGEIVGIIGRNGAGKSTLLKILSRIAKPTTGRVEIQGRVGSLLEVGTGFHPELTGRENVYLNGSILGMSRREIVKKFDEIVAFAEVEQFLDTPVKRYSSGMYVRLAFAVASHLEPEILIVDEVLAVGDAAFQKKCFQKMQEVRKSGRTVLVVSHNLGAILTLCTVGIQLEQGRLVGQGDTNSQIINYLSRLSSRASQVLAERTDREGDGKVRFVRISFESSSQQKIEFPVSGEELRIVIECELADESFPVDVVALSCWTVEGIKLFHIDTSQRAEELEHVGKYRSYVCTIPRLILVPGVYHWNAMVTGGGRTQDHVYSAVIMEVQDGDFFRTGQTPFVAGGAILVDHTWNRNN